MGRGAQGRHAAHRAEADRSRRRRRCSSSARRCASRSTAASATSASTVREATHAFEFPLPGAPDAGDLRSRRRRPEVDQARQEPARCGGGSWRRRGWASIACWRRARSASCPIRPASRRCARRWRGDRVLGRARARRRARSGTTRRDDARDAADRARSTTRTRACGARSAAGLGEFARRRAARPRRWPSGCARATPAYFVEAEAALALGETRSPQALALLPPLLDRPSFQDVIAQRAPSRGWADRRRARAAAHPRRLAARRAWFRARRAVVAALAELGARHAASRAPAREFDRGAPRAIATSACAARRRWRWRGSAWPRRIPAIERALAGELDGRARRRMNDAIRDLRERHAPGRGGPPAARRGRAPARRDRQAARAPRPAGGALPATARPAPPRRPAQGQAPAPGHAPRPRRARRRVARRARFARLRRGGEAPS